MFAYMKNFSSKSPSSWTEIETLGLGFGPLDDLCSVRQRASEGNVLSTWVKNGNHV